MSGQDQSTRLRVNSCHRVIHDVYEHLAGQDIHPRIKEQLQRLDELLAMIDHNVVTSQDLERIEHATNQLMQELGHLFSHQELGPLYQRMKH